MFFNLILDVKLSKRLPKYLEDFFYSQIEKNDIKSDELKKFYQIGVLGNDDPTIFPVIKAKILLKKEEDGFLLNLASHIKEKKLLIDFLNLISSYIDTTNMIGHLIVNHHTEPEFPHLIFGNSRLPVKIIDITNTHTKTGIDYISRRAFS